MDIQELTEQVKGQAGLMVENEAEIVPVLFVVSGERVSIVDLELTERFKRQWRILIPNILRELNADAYILVTEAWRTAGLSKDSPLLKRLTAGEVSVSELPADDKQEIVQITSVEKGKSAQCWHADIKYQVDRRFISGWIKLSEDMQFSGRMFITEW